jgi:hypothetical protein
MILETHFNFRNEFPPDLTRAPLTVKASVIRGPRVTSSVSFERSCLQFTL